MANYQKIPDTLPGLVHGKKGYDRSKDFLKFLKKEGQPVNVDVFIEYATHNKTCSFHEMVVKAKSEKEKAQQVYVRAKVRAAIRSIKHTLPNDPIAGRRHQAFCSVYSPGGGSGLWVTYLAMQEQEMATEIIDSAKSKVSSATIRFHNLSDYYEVVSGKLKAAKPKKKKK